TVLREDGQTAECEMLLGDLPEVASAEIEGRSWTRRRAGLPIEMPLGYHEVTIEADGQRASARFIVTPDRAFVNGGRAAGVAISLYGVRSSRNWGCGDFTDLIEFIAWAATELQAGFVGLNPLHAIHNRRPFNTSPYLPNCIFYQNYIYLDVEAIEDFQKSRRVQRLWRDPAIQAELGALRASEQVEYERVCALKLRFLKLSFVSFLREKGPRAEEFRAFRAREGELLERFATYCALDSWIHAHYPDIWVWPDWPVEYRDPESHAVARFQRKHWRRV